MKYALAVLALTLFTGTAFAATNLNSSKSDHKALVLVVHLVDFSFKPASATIQAGDTVQFVNDDPYPHTVTAANHSFDSGNLDEHASWSYTFKTRGTYAIVCTYHPQMKATIIVK